MHRCTVQAVDSGLVRQRGKLVFATSFPLDKLLCLSVCEECKLQAQRSEGENCRTRAELLD